MVDPVYSRWGVQVFQGDCLDVLKQLPDASVHAVVTDPPYSLRFMQAKWDTHDSPAAFQAWCTEWARECLRVLKPGGHLLAFGGTRTAHRLACGIEDAGFEIRDEIDFIGSRISWVHGQGMPKSRDIGKDIDRMAGAEREVVGKYVHPGLRPEWANYPSCSEAKPSRGTYGEFISRTRDVTAPATDAARQWDGWGTGLRPSHEPIIVARAPLSGTVAATVLEHGTGGLNVGACRVAAPGEVITNHARGVASAISKGIYGDSSAQATYQTDGQVLGRWPPNTVLSHVPALDAAGEVIGDACADGCVDGCPVKELDEQSGIRTSGKLDRARISAENGIYGKAPATRTGVYEQNSGGASRYFPSFRFEAKAPTAERPRVNGQSHATVKPVALLRWMVRLICPPGGTILDCFAGTGTTGQAARAEGFKAILVEKDPTSTPLIVARLDVNPRTEAPPPGASRREPDGDLFDLLEERL